MRERDDWDRDDQADPEHAAELADVIAVARMAATSIVIGVAAVQVVIGVAAVQVVIGVRAVLDAGILPVVPVLSRIHGCASSLPRR